MAKSIDELKNICQDPIIEKSTWYYKSLIRNISIHFTKLLIKTEITANQTTGISILIGILAGLFFAFGTYWYALIGALLLQLWYIFDCVDGEIARYGKSTSIAGKYVDSLNHYIIHPFIFMCIGVGLYIQFNNIFIIVLGVFTAFVMCWASIASNLVYAVLTTETSNSTQEKVEEQVSEMNEKILYRHSKIRFIYNYVKGPFSFSLFILAILIVTVLDILFTNYCPDLDVGGLAIEFGPNIYVSIFSYAIVFNFLYIYFLLLFIFNLNNIIRIFDLFNMLKSYSK